MRKLETLLDDIDYGALPPEWATLDLRSFSERIDDDGQTRGKSLWEYQEDALRNAVKALYRYYDSPPGNGSPAVLKSRFHDWYAANGISLGHVAVGKKTLVRLLDEYYPVEEGRVAYEHLVNRMGFWMATGSGKTLVIVKLIETLRALMARGLIPRHDVLVLTHREDLLDQLRAHVGEYNTAETGTRIRLRDLKEYPEVKREYPSLLGRDEITVFTYRSDNLSDEQKERIIDFRNYDNDGRWYVLLDEAHKGDKDDSKRQHIYSILSREGFLFNFSATFTDPRDILTTAAEFNLASFIERGYGKHIAIMRQENRAFRRDEDYTDEEKQRIVLQSLLMLAFAAQMRERLVETVGDDLYHRPLLIALVNSVNTEDADLKLFFAQLDRIARGTLGPDTFARAKADLLAELQAGPELLYEGRRISADDFYQFNMLTLRDVLRLAFNAESHGAIEVLTRPSNNKELAFKLKSADAPFALIRIGNTADWLKEFLAGYEIVRGFEDESFFEQINRDDSSVNLLMGSRSFYEGWDSNRPNVITFINIGVGADAKKFILQSVGRGVRIEPRRGQRRRLLNLRNSGAVDEVTYTLAEPFLPAIESLFIFGTNRAALETVFSELDQAKEKAEGFELALEVNEAVADRPLLIPAYRPADRPLIEERALRKMEMAPEDLSLLNGYLEYLGDRRLLMAHQGLKPRQIDMVYRSMAEQNHYFNTIGEARRIGRIEILLPRMVNYLDIIPQQVTGFKALADEINHFRRIRVVLREIEELRRKIRAVQEYENPEARKRELKEQLSIGYIDLDGYTAAVETLARASAEETFSPPNGPTLRIKNIAAHYYVPMLLSDDEKIDYITHVIKVPSEVQFIRQLENYLGEADNLFRRFDWWLFSRTVERVDRITIPYYDPNQNRIRDFHPDFIFWLKHGWNDYTILFVDPKGMRQADYQYKIDGYGELFVDEKTGALRVFPYNGLNVRVALAMYTTDANQASKGYQIYWYDHPRDMLQRLIDQGSMKEDAGFIPRLLNKTRLKPVEETFAPWRPGVNFFPSQPIIPRSVSTVSASSIPLSRRQRRMRGKRTATPDLCRLEAWMASKAISITSSGRTLRTGPKRSVVLARTKRSTSRISASVRPL